jgi:hypothetical protein
MYENGKKILELFFDDEAEKPLFPDVIPNEMRQKLQEANLEEPSAFDEAATTASAALTKFIDESG